MISYVYVYIYIRIYTNLYKPFMIRFGIARKGLSLGPDSISLLVLLDQHLAGTQRIPPLGLRAPWHSRSKSKMSKWRCGKLVGCKMVMPMGP